MNLLLITALGFFSLCLFTGEVLAKKKKCKTSKKDFWRVSKGKYVSKDCRNECTCDKNKGAMRCEPLCPATSIIQDCQKVQIDRYLVQKTNCECQVQRCVSVKATTLPLVTLPTILTTTTTTKIRTTTARKTRKPKTRRKTTITTTPTPVIIVRSTTSSKTTEKTKFSSTASVGKTTTTAQVSSGGLDDEDDETSLMHSLDFIITISVLAILFTIMITSILIWKCKFQYQPCCASSSDDDENEYEKATDVGGKKSKWSIMLNKRPLPKLPPEAKRKPVPPARARSVANPYETDAYIYVKPTPEYLYPEMAAVQKSEESGEMHYEELQQNKNDMYEELPTKKGSYEVYLPPSPNISNHYQEYDPNPVK